MAWERRGHHRYVYRSYRQQGRVKKRYFGRGPAAQFMAEVHAARHAQRAQWRTFRTRLDGLHGELRQFNLDISSLLTATLYAAGFHRSGRHRWRMRKAASIFADVAGVSDADPTPAANDAVSAPQGLLQDLQPLVGRARKGDWKVLPRLRQLLEDRADIWQHFSQLGQRLEKDWLDLLSAGQPADVVDIVRQEREALWGDLVDQHSIRLECLLAQRIAANWMAVHYFEQAILLVESSPSGQFLQGCLTRAQRCYAMTLNELKELRRVLPRIQRHVN